MINYLKTIIKSLVTLTAALTVSLNPCIASEDEIDCENAETTYEISVFFQTAQY